VALVCGVGTIHLVSALPSRSMELATTPRERPTF